MFRCFFIIYSFLFRFSFLLARPIKFRNDQAQLNPLSKEIFLNINEYYFLNLDSEYPIDHGFFNISSISPTNTSNLLTFPITNNLDQVPITTTLNITRDFIKLEKILIKTNYSLYVTLDQSGLSLIEGIRNISSMNLKTFFTFGTLNIPNLYCKNFAQILLNKSLDNMNFQELLIVDCNLEKDKTIVFLKVLLQMNVGNWSFIFIDKQTPEYGKQADLFSCNNRILYGFKNYLFFFCPYSETFSNDSFLFVYSVENNETSPYCTIDDSLVQDVQLDFKNRIIILDYYFGLIIYDNLCKRCSNIKFSRGEYLFILSRKEESIFYENIKTYFYVATSTAVLEILYLSDNSLVYTKYFDVTLKNEHDIYNISNVFLTSKYLITLQKKVDKNIDLPKYLVKVYSIENERESNILYLLNVDLISAKFYPIEDQTNHNLIVKNVDLAKENKVNLTAIFINERSLILTTQGQFSEKIIKCSLILDGYSKLNPDVKFSVNFTIYLLTPGITNMIIYKENIVKNYNVNENYFEIPLYNFVIGAHINYLYLKEIQNYDLVKSKPIKDIYIDDYYNIVIEDKNFLKSSVILDSKMDVNYKFLKILLHYSKNKAVFYLYCFEFSSESIGNCFPDTVYIIIKENITSFAKDDDLLFFYVKKINSVKICLVQRRICQSHVLLNFSSLDELIYVNRNLLLTYVINENNFLTIYFLRLVFNIDFFKFDIWMNKSFRLPYSGEFIGFDLHFLESGFLMLKYKNLLRILKINLINRMEYDMQMGNYLDLNDSDKVLLLKNHTFISISYKNNYISEYQLVNLYTFKFRRNYLLYDFNITDHIESFTNGYLVFVSAIDTFSNSHVLLIFNPQLPLSQTLIKIIRDSHTMRKFYFLRTTDTLSPFYSVCLRTMQGGQTYLNIINTQPYIYGYFSKDQIEVFAKNESYFVPINIAFGSGSRKLISTLQIKFSYNESMINYANDLDIDSPFFFNLSFKIESNNSLTKFTVHPHFIFKGPIENYNATNGVIMEEILQINQSFENSDFYSENLLDLIKFGPIIIVLTREKILFFEMNDNLIERKNIPTNFSDDSCRLSHHNSFKIFFKFCQTDNDSVSNIISVYNYTSLHSINIGEIYLPNSIGKIKEILLKDDLVFFITYLINNQNQERLTICNFTNIILSKTFSPINNFEAEDFEISAFKTFDFDAHLRYINNNILITIIIILIPNIIEIKNLGIIIFNLTNNALEIVSKHFLYSNYMNNETCPQNVEILNVTKKDILCLISTSKNVYKILLSHDLSTLSYLYTYQYYHRCENILQKPLLNDNFLISFCVRYDEGETIKDILPIFRQTIPIFMVKIYDTEYGENSSHPIRILTTYNSNINFTIKAVLLKSKKLSPKLIVSDVFSFLVEYDLRSNLTISNFSSDEMEISITASNRYGKKTIDVILPNEETMNYKKLIIYIVFGCFNIAAVVLLILFLLFGIKKFESKRKRNDNSMLVDSNIIGSKSLNQSLLNRRIRKKTKKELRTFD